MGVGVRVVADAAVSFRPQESQNFWPLGFDVPHFEQPTAVPNGTAHDPQNFAPSRFSWPQFGQRKCYPHQNFGT